MLNAEEAKRLSKSNGRQEKIDEGIRQIEKQVKEACEKGSNYICFGMKDEYGGNSYFIDGQFERLPEVKEHFLKQGFTFKDTGYIGGVYQHTERMYW